MTTSHELLSYPFPVVEQPENKRAHMRAFTEDYIRRHGLFVDPPRHTSMVCHFAQFCTPGEASVLTLEAACMYLALVLFVDDEREGSNNLDRDGCFEQYCEILRGRRCESSSGPGAALQALIDLVERLGQETGVATSQFRARTIEMFASQRWERQIVESERRHVHAVADYLKHRPRTIANAPFMSLLKVAQGVDELTLDSMSMCRLLLMEELATRMIYLSNDVFSAHREKDDPTALSLVCILWRTESLSWVSSLEQTIARHDAAIESYVRIRQELLSERSDQQILSHLEIMENDISGNLAAIRRISSRYKLPDTSQN